MERVALYARVSTEDQSRHGLSLAEQEHSLTEYAKDHKMKIVDTYIDAGISARKRYTKRPELLRLLEDVKAGRIDTILFIKLDRWFRSVEQYYEVQRILDEYHVTWRATQEDYETVTASGRFKVNIMLSVAQDEADRTSERIKFVFDGKRERNEPTNGRVPKGYRVVNKKVEIDPVTGLLMQAALKMYIETGSPSKVFTAFPELNLNYYSVRRVFASTAYMGQFGQISIPPLITPEEHERIMQLQGHVVHKTDKNRIYLFSGLVFCPECGGRLAGKPSRRKSGNDVIYYSCSSFVSKTGCSQFKNYREEMIEEYLLTHIDSKIQFLIESEKKSAAISYKPQRDAINRKLAKLPDLYVNDLIDLEEYKKRRDALESELAAVPPDKPAVDLGGIQKIFYPDWQTMYIDLLREEKRAFWRKTIKSIHVDGEKVGDFVLRKNVT